MAATGYLAARKTDRQARGLAAMAAVGFTRLLGPAPLWYADGQSPVAGTTILTVLARRAGHPDGCGTLSAVGGVSAVKKAPFP